MNTLNNFMFLALPYMAIIVFLIGTIYKFKFAKYKYSSLSSQFLEGRTLFWGSVPFHWSIIFLFVGHLMAFLIPQSVLAWNGEPVRLLVLEITGFVFGLTAFIGLLTLFIRRILNDRIKVVSNYMDIIIEVLLLLQIILGLWVAFGYRWGSSWFASVLTPYLKSIFLLQPNIDAISAMPIIIQLHVINAFLILLLMPFSRLVHMLVLPIDYLWRPFQQVIWYWNKKGIRDPKTNWTIKRPWNN